MPNSCEPMGCSPRGSPPWDFPGKNTRMGLSFPSPLLAEIVNNLKNHILGTVAEINVTLKDLKNTCDLPLKKQMDFGGSQWTAITLT